jgi:two-component system LytT family sensor kinase
MREAAAPQRSPYRGDPGPGSVESSWMGRRALLLNFAFWTLFGAVTASNWLLSPVIEQFPYPGRLFAKAFFNSYLWAILTPVVFWFAARFNPENGARIRRALLLLGVAIAIGLLVAGAQAVVNPKILSSPATPATGEWPTIASLTRRYFPTAVVTYFVVLVAGFMSDISRRYRARQREADQLQAQSAELHAQLAEARLSMLRTQLNPHFLFNTLNAVSALVAKDPRGVRDMIALLSELLRYALKDSGDHEIPLDEELRLLRLYLEIQEIRYQGQLRTIVSIDPDAREALVPNLILQPLVENAVKHGIDRAGGHGTIEVLASRVGDDLVLSVRDTGPGEEIVVPGGGTGVGLRLTRERLAELYGTEQLLELKPVAGGGMVAQVVLPYHTSEEIRFAEEVSQA